MLTITTQQSQAFDREQRYKLAQELLPRLQQALPEVWPSATAPAANRTLIATVLTGVAAAIENDFEDDDEIMRFLELWSLVENLGDTDAHHDAIAMLGSETIATGWPKARTLLVALCHGAIVDAPIEASV